MTGEEQSSEESDTCRLCKKEVSKYCCPRCNILYCSLSCYKSDQHLACSESFYKDCIDQELKATQPDSSTRQRMLEILSRNYRKNTNSDNAEILDDLDSSDSDDVDNLGDSDDGDNLDDVHDSDDDDSLPDLVERMRDINLDDAERVWEALTMNEKKEFEELIKSEDVTKVLSLWEPWWLNHKEGPKIQEIKDDVVEEPYVACCPPIQKTIKHFSLISSRDPSPCVQYNLYNVLAAYVYVVRLFNGEHHFFDREAVSCLNCICKNLNGNVNFNDAPNAVLSVVHECYNNPSIITDAETKRLIVEDLQSLLRGPDNLNKNFYVLSALSDIHALLTQTKVKYNKAKANKCNELAVIGEFARKFAEHDMLELPQPSKKEILAYLRKIDYFLSYMTLYGDEVTSSVFVIL